MDVQFIDTTFRDGSQSLWASGMRTGMMEAVAQTMDQVGFAAIEVPINGIYFKKIVRDLKEDPWELMRSLGRRMPNTIKGGMAGGFILPFEPPPPRSLIELYYACLVKTGAFNRAQLTSNTVDQIKRTFPWIIPVFRGLGVRIVLALSYTISPRHSDEYYAQKTRELAALRPDAIYLKDQGGLLTIDRARTLIPAMLKNAGAVPLELHSHCTTALAPLVYLEALKLGVRVLHTAVPPLAQGASQPSVLAVLRNARLLGYSAQLNERLIEMAAQRLTAIARQEGLPIGAPLEYAAAQYIHQVPGGVISNLEYQLAEMRMKERLGEVLEEYDALICPTFAVPALPAEWDHGDLAEGRSHGTWMDVMMTVPFNIASRCPVLSVPSGRAGNGVPTGLSVVGRTYDDVTAFRVAAAHEERYAWYTDPAHRPAIG